MARAFWLILAVVIAIGGVVFGVIGFRQAKSVEKFANRKIEAVNQKYWEITGAQEKRLNELEEISKKQKARIWTIQTRVKKDLQELKKEICDFRPNLDSLAKEMVSLKETDSFYQRRFEEQRGTLRLLTENDRTILILIQKTAGSNVYFLGLPVNKKVVKETKHLLQQPEWQEIK